MDLTPLDLGLPKLTSQDCTVCTTAKISAREFESATQRLISQWPILGARLSILRTTLVNCDTLKDISNIWQGKTADRNLEDFVSLPERKGSAHIINVQGLENELDFGFGIGVSMKQHVFTIRTVFLRNGCAVCFKFQHPLCDATGSDSVVQAFLSLLNGNEIDYRDSLRPPLQLKKDIKEKAGEIGVKERHKVALSHSILFSRGWAALLKGAIKQKLRNVFYPCARRVSKTLFLPQREINDWMDEATKQGLSVTENDLLLAFIYQASLEPRSTQTFGLIMNIQRYLDSQALLYNPMCLVPISSLIPSNTLSDTKPTILQIASKVRRTITSARDPECIADILNQHDRLMKSPFLPRSTGTRAPQVVVSSWSHLDVLGYNICGQKPAFVQINIDVCPMLRQAGAGLDDMLATWKDKGDEGTNNGGYWIHGRLSEAVWERMTTGLSATPR